MGLLAEYRKNWPRIGALLGMGIAGATALSSKKMSRPQVLAALNFAALTVHQYEEYEDPGFFPGQFNRGVLHSDTPDHYPLDTNTAMIINTALAYPFYAAPVLVPKHRVLGLAPVLFGFAQAFGHGIIFPRLAKARYSPGFLASFFLHVPIGVAYIQAVKSESGLEVSDFRKAGAMNAAFAVSCIAAPNVILKRKDSPYRFTAKQVGPYAPSDPSAEGSA